MTSKVCTECGQVKLISEFYRHEGCKDGYRKVCKACINIKRKKFYAIPANEHQIKTRVKERMENLRNQARILLSPSQTCQDCGATESQGKRKALEFHHINGEGRHEHYAWWIKISREDPVAFATKAALLCHQCHGKRHRLEEQVAVIGDLQARIAELEALLAEKSEVAA